MEGFIDPILVNRFYSAVTNATTLRSNSGSSSFDRRRDIPVECGFPDEQEMTPERLRKWYQNDALAARVVEVWPKECWKEAPEVYESEDAKINTPFEKAIDKLGRSLISSEPGFYKEGAMNVINDYLQRADIASRINRYSVILLGIADGKDLSEPIEAKTSSTGNADALKYLRVFDESLATISAREMDKTNPRFGQPTTYNITFDSPDDMGVMGSVGTQLTSDVHWTRVVHIVDNPFYNDFLGYSAIKEVAYDLLTCQKSRWGSGEMFWNGASPKLSFETHPQLGGDVIINKSRMKDEIEKALRGTQQWWTIAGMTAKSIAPVAVDPKPFNDIGIQSMCIRMGVPVPIFIGYEVGENAGTMNTVEWNKRVKGRQDSNLIPRKVCPFYNRLINIGILPIPYQGYKCEWQESTSNSAKDKAQLQNLKINMVVAYIKNGLSQLIPPVEFMVRFLEMTEEEAIMILDKAREEIAKQQAVTTVPPATDTTQQQSNGQSNNNPGEVTPQQTDTNPIAPSTVSTDVQMQPQQDVQATALNGAQISSLLQITDSLAQGLYTREAAKSIIQAAFPIMDITLIEKIVNSIEPGSQQLPPDQQKQIPQQPSANPNTEAQTQEDSQPSVNTSLQEYAEINFVTNVPEGGNWVTLEDGRKVYFKGSRIYFDKDDEEGISTEVWEEAKELGIKTKHEEKYEKKKDSKKSSTDKEDVTDEKTYTSKKDKFKADQEAKQTHGEWASNLKTNEKIAIGEYGTGEHYRAVNGALRTGNAPNEYRQKIIKGLDSAIESAPEFKRDMPLYRGVENTKFIGNLKPGAVFSDKGFVSASSNLSVAEGFTTSSGGIIKIVNTKGIKAASVTASGKATFKGEKSENEYILARSTKFKVKKVSSEQINGRTVNVIHVEVVK